MTLRTQPIDQFLKDLAAKEPTPGGGAVAGILSSLATALGTMVLKYSSGKKSLAEHAELHDDCMSFLEEAKNEAFLLSDADAEAYEIVSALWKLPEDDETRIEEWDDALAHAIKIPLKTMALSERILLTLKTLVGNTNTMLDSDLAIAAILAESSARSAHWNVGINTRQMKNEEQKVDFFSQATALRDSCKELAHFIEHSCEV